MGFSNLAGQIQLAIIHAIDSAVSLIAGVYVAVTTLQYAEPLTQTAIQYLGIFGMYYGLHVYTHNAISKAAATTPITK